MSNKQNSCISVLFDIEMFKDDTDLEVFHHLLFFFSHTNYHDTQTDASTRIYVGTSAEYGTNADANADVKNTIRDGGSTALLNACSLFTMFTLFKLFTCLHFTLFEIFTLLFTLFEIFTLFTLVTLVTLFIPFKLL